MDRVFKVCVNINIMGRFFVIKGFISIMMDIFFEVLKLLLWIRLEEYIYAIVEMVFVDKCFHF